MRRYVCFILNGVIGVLRTILLVKVCITLLYAELLVVGLILNALSIHTDENGSIFLVFVTFFIFTQISMKCYDSLCSVFEKINRRYTNR